MNDVVSDFGFGVFVGVLFTLVPGVIVLAILSYAGVI